MAIIQLFNSAVPSLTVYPTPTPSIGGAKGSAQITGASISELHPPMAAAILGGGKRWNVAKFFIYNSNTTNDYQQASVNLINSLNVSPTGPLVVTVVSDSTLDNTNFKCRCIGWDTSGTPVPQQDDALIMNGTTVVASGLSWSQLVCIEARNVTTGVLTPTNGNWSVFCNSTLVGILVKGYYSMTSEVQIALVATLGDTTTYTSAGTQPPSGLINGLTPTQPNTVLTGLPMANAGVLTHLVAQGGWSVWAVQEMRKPSSDLQVIVMTDGAFYS